MPRLLVSIIHYQTPDLLQGAVRSFRTFYPEADLLLVDNGSTDGSAGIVRDFVDAQTRCLLLERNTFHGPAMDHVLRTEPADAVFFLDSDTITRRGGFLEPMAESVLHADDVLGSGRILFVDRRGFGRSHGIPVPVSAFMMVRRSAYLTLPPFVHHGLPVLGTCAAAYERGLAWVPFPVDEYVEHLGRGTAGRYGYGLGFRSRWDYLLHRLGM